jgi:transposase
MADSGLGRKALVRNPGEVGRECYGAAWHAIPTSIHLFPSELIHRARHVPTLVEARRWQLLALVADGQSATAAATLVGVHADYAGRVIRRYNRDGPASLRDQLLEQKPPMRPALLSAEQQQELAEAVQGPGPGGGLWTGPDVARWIAEKTGPDHVAAQRGHDYLRRVGMSPQRPRPRHTDADPVEQDAFKKTR